MTRLRQLRSRLRLLPLLAACAVCFGATSESCKLGREARDRNDFSDFSLELQLKNDADEFQETFDQEERVHFVLNVTNTGDEEKTLEFPSTQQADFAVITDDRVEQVVWVASQNTTPSTTKTELDFSPGQTRTFTLDAVLTDTDGFLEKGDYQVVGALLANSANFATDPLADNDLASDPVPMTIE